MRRVNRKHRWPRQREQGGEGDEEEAYLHYEFIRQLNGRNTLPSRGGSCRSSMQLKVWWKCCCTRCFHCTGDLYRVDIELWRCFTRLNLVYLHPLRWIRIASLGGSRMHLTSIAISTYTQQRYKIVRTIVWRARSENRTFTWECNTIGE